MKTTKKVWPVQRARVQFCGRKSITIAGRTLTADPDRSYVEFFLSHAFPVVIAKDGTGIHPQVVANSYASMQDKVFNLSHLMKNYDPKANPRDRILGTVVAVEFPAPATYCPHCDVAVAWADEMTACPSCEAAIEQTQLRKIWKVQADKSLAPAIRAVAVMHKAAELVEEILASWFEGRAPYGQEWTVSMENQHEIEDSGFLVSGTVGVEKFADATPPDLKAMGYCYVPCRVAPVELLQCLNNEDDDLADGDQGTRIKRDFNGQSVLVLLGGLNGSIRYHGVALTPLGKEREARVSKMLASEEMIDARALFEPLHGFLDQFLPPAK